MYTALSKDILAPVSSIYFFTGHVSETLSSL